MSSLQLAQWAEPAEALARLLMALVFLYSAASKLLDWPAGLVEVRSFGLPMPGAVLAGTVALQLAGGLMLMTGWQARAAALLLAAFTLLASLMAHPFWRSSGSLAMQQRTTFAEHMAITGGLLMVVIHG